MESKYYTIVITFQAKPGKVKSFQAFLASIIDVALQSSGCIKHELHQSIKDPSVFMFYENWINKHAHDIHALRPEVKAWRAKLDDFLAKPYQACFWETVV